MSETITLDRTLQPPLQFDGTLLAHASGQFVNTPAEKPNRDWFEIAVYETEPHGSAGASPSRVVAITYHKNHRGQYEHRSAFATDDPARTLAEYDPIAVLAGFPPGPAFAGRQAALEQRARLQFNTLVSAVLRTFPERIT